MKKDCRFCEGGGCQVCNWTGKKLTQRDRERLEIQGERAAEEAWDNESWNDDDSDRYEEVH